MQNSRDLARMTGRVERMSSAVPRGDKILEFVRASATRKILIDAAETGQPSIGAISKKLAKLVGLDVLRLTLVKQFCGLAIRAVLAEEGLVPIQHGVRLYADPVFTTGTVYARRFEKGSKREEDLLRRIIDTLSVDEMRGAAAYIAERLELLG